MVTARCCGRRRRRRTVVGRTIRFDDDGGELPVGWRVAGEAK